MRNYSVLYRVLHVSHDAKCFSPWVYSHLYRQLYSITKMPTYGLYSRVNMYMYISKYQLFLAHLSQRLKGELIGYSWSGIRPSSSVRCKQFHTSSSPNRWPDQSQILCRVSLGRGNESFFAASGSDDQDGRHAHIC